MLYFQSFNYAKHSLTSRKYPDSPDSPCQNNFERITWAPAVSVFVCSAARERRPKCRFLPLCLHTNTRIRSLSLAPANSYGKMQKTDDGQRTPTPAISAHTAKPAHRPCLHLSRGNKHPPKREKETGKEQRDTRPRQVTWKETSTGVFVAQRGNRSGIVAGNRRRQRCLSDLGAARTGHSTWTIDFGG